MYSVYALVDPRDEVVRYVGMSKNAWRRYAMHLLNVSGTKSPKDTWIEELRKIDLSPLMTILETVETEEVARDRERYWIRHYLSEGVPILNNANAGKRREFLIEGNSTVAQIARGLRISEDSIVKMLRTKKMPGRKVGKEWEVDPEEFHHWLEQHRNTYQQPEQES